MRALDSCAQCWRMPTAKAQVLVAQPHRKMCSNRMDVSWPWLCWSAEPDLHPPSPAFCCAGHKLSAMRQNLAGVQRLTGAQSTCAPVIVRNTILDSACHTAGSSGRLPCSPLEGNIILKTLPAAPPLTVRRQLSTGHGTAGWPLWLSASVRLKQQSKRQQHALPANSSLAPRLCLADHTSMLF